MTSQAYRKESSKIIMSPGSVKDKNQITQLVSNCPSFNTHCPDEWFLHSYTCRQTEKASPHSGPAGCWWWGRLGKDRQKSACRLLAPPRHAGSRRRPCGRQVDFSQFRFRCVNPNRREVGAKVGGELMAVQMPRQSSLQVDGEQGTGRRARGEWEEAQHGVGRRAHGCTLRNESLTLKFRWAMVKQYVFSPKEN